MVDNLYIGTLTKQMKTKNLTLFGMKKCHQDYQKTTKKQLTRFANHIIQLCKIYIVVDLLDDYSIFTILPYHMHHQKDSTSSRILAFVCILFFVFYVIALDRTHYHDYKRDCQSIENQLENMSVEATPQRLDLENAYFQLKCNK